MCVYGYVCILTYMAEQQYAVSDLIQNEHYTLYINIFKKGWQ